MDFVSLGLFGCQENVVDNTVGNGKMAGVYWTAAIIWVVEPSPVLFFLIFMDIAVILPLPS